MPALFENWPESARIMAQLNPTPPAPGLMRQMPPRDADSEPPRPPMFADQRSGGWLSGLESRLSSPLFLAGAGLMSGGMPGAMQGLQGGLQARRQEQMLPLERMMKEAQAQYWLAKAQGKAPGEAKLGLNPIWGVDEQGNPALIQLNNQNATASRVQLPAGVKIGKDLQKSDAGTHWVFTNPITGQTVAVLPKDVAGEAAERASGKATGDAQASLASLRSKMPGLEKVVQELDQLSEDATYTVGGRAIDAARRQVGMEPRKYAIARERYVAMVNNQILPLLKDTFGAQFTEREGESLKSTLGDPNKSPKEKQAVLRAFIEQKRRDVGALENQAGGGGGAVRANVPTETTGGAAIKRIQSDAEFDALPPGARFIDPNGKVRIKPRG